MGKPEHSAPFARPALPGFSATTRRPVPVLRIGTLSLTGSSAWGSPLSDRAGYDPRPIASDGWAGPTPRPTTVFGTTGSHVPHQSLSQARATYTPDITWAVSRSLPDC